MPTVSYIRVSTARQGQSGLGLEAQRQAVRDYLGCDPDYEFEEVESGKANDRPELHRALNHAELTGGTLIVAKLDRLSRDLAFLATLQKSRVHKIVFADMPDASREMIAMMAFLAQWERERISDRTKAALKASKARGKQLGGDRGNLPAVAHEGALASAKQRSDAALTRAAKLRPYIDEARERGCRSNRDIAQFLNASGIRTVRMKYWCNVSVGRLLDQIAQLP